MKLELQKQLFNRYPKAFRFPGDRLHLANAGYGETEDYLSEDSGPLDFWGKSVVVAYARAE